MPHFSVSWDRAIAALCPQWLEELVNEDETGDSGLEVEMSLRLFEDLPLQPLPSALAALERQGVRNLSPEDISAIEATFDILSTPGACESDLDGRRAPSPVLMLFQVPARSKLENCFERHDEREE